MANYYTISDCALKDQKIARLLGLILTNAAKLALDNRSVIVSKYITETKKESDEKTKTIYKVIKAIIELIATIPQDNCYADFFDIPSESTDPYLDVCCQTVDKRLVVGSINKCLWAHGVTSHNKYNYHDKEITIMELNDIIIENPNNYTTYNIKDSIIADHNSKIAHTQNH